MYFSECKCVFLTLGVLIAGVPYSYQISPVLSEELKSDTQDIIYISPAGIICIGCDVGEFVETDCNEEMERSQCKPCPRDTFSTTPGGDTSCQHCTPCSHGVNETSGCTATSDTVCACPKGTVPNIIDGLILNCIPVETLLSSTKVQETTTTDPVTPSQDYKPRTTHIPPSNGYESKPTDDNSEDRIYISPDGIKCIGCDVGEHVETDCNEPMGRSQCKPCPNGTFSTTPGGATSCQHCRTCSHGVNETSGCTATSDTVCACPKGTVPNIIDGSIQNCIPVETQSLLPSTTEYDTTTTGPVTPSQDYKPRTTHIPPSNGYETNSDVTTIILCLYGVLILCLYGVLILRLVGGQVKALFRKWRRRYRKGKFWSCTAGLVYN